MTTVIVTIKATDQLGDPIAKAVITAQLTNLEVTTSGYVIPEKQSVIADENGIATMALFPNELGSTQSMYRFTIKNPATGQVETLDATIPNQNCNLHDVAYLPPYPGKTDGQLAVDEAIAAVAPAIAARDAAIAAKNIAVQAAEDAQVISGFNVEIGTVQTGEVAQATMSGTVPNRILNLVLPKGDQGEQGIQGIPGLNGTNGIDGTNGANGVDGADGESAYELAVANGFVGTLPQWLASLKGEQGIQGLPGNDGADGINGINGTNGINGVDGEDGLSAYQIALNNGFVGTESQWLASLEGPQGPQGEIGPVGPSGSDVSVFDEGTLLTTAVTSINFVGAGITVTNTGSSVTVTSNAGTVDYGTVTTALGYVPLPNTYVPTWASVTGKPIFSTVATSGDYNDLFNKPSIPVAYVLPTATTSVLGGVKIDGTTITIAAGVISTSKNNIGLGNVENKSSANIRSEIVSDDVTNALGFTPLANTYAPTWTSVTGKPTFATVATSGSYADLTGLPTLLILGSVAGSPSAATGAVGSSNDAAKADHVHPHPTALQVGASIPGALISSSTGLTAAGTTQATALGLTTDLNYVSTVAANTGVRLPAVASGRTLIVINRGANTLRVYPDTGHNIDALAANAYISLPVNGFLELFGSSTTQWNSTQNAITSASLIQGTVAGANGGTGVNNNGKTITLGGNLTTSGAFASTFTMTAATSVTFPTSGTLAVLGANTFTGVQTFLGTRSAKVDVTTNIDLALGDFFKKTLSGATTFSVSNVAAGGITSSFILDLTNGGSATITWWTAIKWAGGTAPTLTASGRDVLGFFTHDNGTTWTGLLLGKDVK